MEEFLFDKVEQASAEQALVAPAWAGGKVPLLAARTNHESEGRSIRFLPGAFSLSIEACEEMARGCGW